MPTSTVEIKGLDKVHRRLLTAAKQISNIAARALYEEALIEMAESMRRTPVDTGALRGSHITTPPVVHLGGDISVTIRVGGPAAPYAVIVHEDTDALHKVGQAKFLESTILESAPFLPARVAKRMQIIKAFGL